MTEHNHDHAGHGSLREAQSRALWIALVANGVFLVAEVVGGIVFGSLALLADAAHMVSDVAGLGIALVAQQLLTRPSSARHTYGLQRAEVLGAQVNGLALLGAAAWIVYEAIRRLGGPVEVEAGGMLVVATLGLGVNVVSSVILYRARGESLNMRGAFAHMTMDAVGSVAAIGAGICVALWDAGWVDPAVSVLVAALVLHAAWRLLRDTTHVLLEGSPRGMRPDEVERAIADHPDVDGVHHMHLWNLASDTPAMSAHVVLTGEPSLHDAQQIGAGLRTVLRRRFGIEHATLELECHDCEAGECGPATTPR